MSNYKFKLSQIVFVIPVKMQGVIENRNKQSGGGNVYEVRVMYQNRIWKATFNESELSVTQEEQSLDQPR